MFGGPTSPFVWRSSGDSPDMQSLAVWCGATGQDENAANNWGWLDVVNPTDRVMVSEAWQRVRYGPHIFSLTYRVCLKKEEYQLYNVLHVPIFDDRRQLLYWLVFFVRVEESSQLFTEHWEQKIINSLLYTQTELIARIQEVYGESLAQLEAIFESITDSIIVCDSNRHIIKTNTAALHMFRPLLDQYPDCFRSSFDEVIDLLQAFDEQGHRLAHEQWPLVRLLHGEDLRGENLFEMHLRFPNGQDVYLSYSGSPLRNRGGQIIGAVLVMRDVSERRRMEDRIHHSFRILLALAEEVVDLPKRARTKSVKEQRASGQAPSPLPYQVAGEYLVELARQMLECDGVGISMRNAETGQFQLIALATRLEDDKAVYYANFADFALSDYLEEPALALLQANESVVQDTQLSTPRSLGIKALLAPMILDGLLVGIFSVKKTEPCTTYTEDEKSLIKAVAKLVLLVIERERLEQEWIEAHTSELALREANRRFDTFLSIASHELRTPLAGIKGKIQLAQRRLAFVKDPEWPEKDVLMDKLERVQDYLLHAEHRVNVQNRMISDLLDVSRIQANKLDLVMHPCNLVEIVHEAVDDQRYTLTERIITFARPANKELLVIGDADRLGQVVHNYLTNALKYSPVDQPVAVCVETCDGMVRVSVQDHGPGLSAEEQERVWERFYRVKDLPTQGDASPGLGLGLHICRTILEAHHGSFGVESVLGQGSTFWFVLPLAYADAPSCADAKAGSTSSSTRG